MGADRAAYVSRLFHIRYRFEWNESCRRVKREIDIGKCQLERLARHGMAEMRQKVLTVPVANILGVIFVLELLQYTQDR